MGNTVVYISMKNLARAVVMGLGLCLLGACIPKGPEAYHVTTEWLARVGEHQEGAIGWAVVSVAKDKTVSVRLDSGQVLTAKPGEYFDFLADGRHRPKLVSASHWKGEAKFWSIVH
jgi:hypothetical protein